MLFTVHLWSIWPDTYRVPASALARLWPLLPRLPVATDPNVVAIGTFFSRLTGDLIGFALAMAGSFFALSALLYMPFGLTGNERMRTHAIGYAALDLMAGTFPCSSTMRSVGPLLEDQDKRKETSMASSPVSSPRRRTHLVPTHVRVPETLLTLAGVSISVRQFLLLLVGIALSYHVWLACGLLALLPAGQLARVLFTAATLGLTLALAFVWVAARSLDLWCLVILRYLARPRRFVWRSVRFDEPGLGAIDQTGRRS